MLNYFSITGVVFVVWDKNNQLGSYRYGFQGQQYDVELDKSDKSVRLVDPGEIEIGCLVTRGIDTFFILHKRKLGRYTGVTLSVHLSVPASVKSSFKKLLLRNC